MTDYEARYQSNGDDLENSYGGLPSLQPREVTHSGLDDHRDSKSQHESRDYERGSSRSREKEKTRDKEREKDRDLHRDRERDKNRERSKDRDGEKDRDRHHRDIGIKVGNRVRGGIGDEIGMVIDYHRSRDYDRHKDYDRDREDRHRLGSRSRGISEHRSKSRSRSRSPSKSKRISGFDMAPPASAMLAAGSIAAAAVAAAAVTYALQDLRCYILLTATFHLG